MFKEIILNQEENTSSTDFVKNKIADEDTIYDLAELFKIFGDSTRTKILNCLEIQDLYVGEIAEILNMSVSAVSHQLRVLKTAKLVKGTKEGKEVKYSLDDNHVSIILECGLSHLRENHKNTNED
ncbi:MAG: winged helix-turn-helix transcriptional regulator [Treponema sp.]|nr:winged helix-turn-helix transcriptional regulator [Treponema sp.]